MFPLIGGMRNRAWGAASAGRAPPESFASAGAGSMSGGGVRQAPEDLPAGARVDGVAAWTVRGGATN